MDQHYQPIPIKGAEQDLSLRTLQNELHSICTKWYFLGIQLEIAIGTLKGIKQECREVAGLCLVEVLNEWLKNKPSWKGLVEALRSPAVSETSLAHYIASKYCHHCGLPDLPEDVGDDIFYRKGAHSTQSHYSASVPANLWRYVPKHEYRRLSEPNHLPESDEPMLLSKELEEKFLPTIQHVREKMRIEMEIDTHFRHCKILDRMYRRLSEPTSEEAQVHKEILDEKKQQIHRLQQKLAEPVFKQAEENMELQRTESLKHRDPIIKKQLPGTWRIINTDERKLLATVDNGHVVLLERQRGKLEHKDIICRKDWAPCGIAMVERSIFVGDAAGAVPCISTRKQLITATNDIPGRKGLSRLLKFSKQKCEKLKEERCQFGDPSGMAFSKDKVLHVCDRATNKIWMLDTNLQLDTSRRRTGYYDSEEGHFNRPVAIDFDSDGSMYVLDQGNCRVQVFNPEFQLQRTFGENVLKYPSCGIHVTKEFVYVTQIEENCVSVFDKWTGAFVISFSSEKFQKPVGIAVDSEGYIYVCDDNSVWVF